MAEITQHVSKCKQEDILTNIVKLLARSAVQSDIDTAIGSPQKKESVDAVHIKPTPLKNC